MSVPCIPAQAQDWCLKCEHEHPSQEESSGWRCAVLVSGFDQSLAGTLKPGGSGAVLHCPTIHLWTCCHLSTHLERHVLSTKEQDFYWVPDSPWLAGWYSWYCSFPVVTVCSCKSGPPLLADVIRIFYLVWAFTVFSLQFSSGLWYVCSHGSPGWRLYKSSLKHTGPAITCGAGQLRQVSYIPSSDSLWTVTGSVPSAFVSVSYGLVGCAPVSWHFEMSPPTVLWLCWAWRPNTCAF